MEIISQFSVHQEITANLPMQKLISLHQKSALIASMCICGHEGTVPITISHHQKVKEFTIMIWYISSEFYCFKCLQLIILTDFSYIFPIP